MAQGGCMKDKCKHCEDFQYVTDKNRKDICWRCDLQDAKDEFWRVFEEETWLGRMLVKFLDWLENILSRRR